VRVDALPILELCFSQVMIYLTTPYPPVFKVFAPIFFFVNNYTLWKRVHLHKPFYKKQHMFFIIEFRFRFRRNRRHSLRHKPKFRMGLIQSVGHKKRRWAVFFKCSYVFLRHSAIQFWSPFDWSKLIDILIFFCFNTV